MSDGARVIVAGPSRRGPIPGHVQGVSTQSTAIALQHRSNHGEGAAELRSGGRRQLITQTPAGIAVRILFGTPVRGGALISRLRGGLPMKTIITILAAGLLAPAFAIAAHAATQKSPGKAQLQAQCQAQAKKKYSAIHFLKRRDYVKNCMHQKA